MSGLLSRITASKRAELPALRVRRLPHAPPLVPVDLARSEGEPLRLIAEIKHRSPSAGTLSESLSVAARAAAYERGGASMISVLCDAPFFGGGYHHLAEARAACSLPLLCKEFVLDEIQLDAARAYGASAVLLIVRCLDPVELLRLIVASRDRGLLPIVEVFDERETRTALDAGATCVGVNSRDLDTLELDAPKAARILAMVPPDIVRAYFSGIKDQATVAQTARTSADAALVGEVLMRQASPEPLLRSFVQAARGELR